MKSVRFGVVGLGKVARTRFLPAIARSHQAEVTAIATGRCVSVMPPPETPDVALVPYDRFLDAWAGRLDAVYIALPNHLHLEWASRAAKAGLHVLCEKPLAAYDLAASALSRLCAERGVLLAEAFMYRHDPRHGRVRELIRQGCIGRVGLLEASFSYLLEDLGNVRLDAERLGGALMDVGCYGIDLARYLFEEEPSAVDARALWGKDSGVDELTLLDLVFPSGRMATMTASTHLVRRNCYRVIGTEGVITVPAAFIATETGATRIEIECGGDSRVETFAPFDQFATKIDRFSEAIRSGAHSVPTPMENGVANARVLAMARCRLDERPRTYWTWNLDGR